MIFLALTLVAYIAATLLCCYMTKPEVSEGKFAFSITYEYKGETKIFSGVFVTEFAGSSTVQGEHNRYWNENTIYDDPKYPETPHIIEQNDELKTTLAIQENMYAGYFMGDPLCMDHYENHGLEGPEPYIEYYDYKNNISLDEYNRDAVLESIGFKIIDFTYDEPIENSFSFSGVSYEADNVIIFVAILLVFLLLCLIFVRKDNEYQYTNLDKVGTVLNFLVGIVAVPFICLTCVLFGLVESGVKIIDQSVYNIPPFGILCLALSVVFRRKGYSKTSFFIQFGGILAFILVLLTEALL